MRPDSAIAAVIGGHARWLDEVAGKERAREREGGSAKMMCAEDPV